MTLKDHRIKLGMTQKDLAKASGVSIKTIQKIENHKQLIGNVTVNTVTRLARTLGLKIEDMTGKVIETEDKIYFENDFIWFQEEKAGE